MHGVSLNATVGENGIITQAQQASLSTKIANYTEEFDLNKTDAMIEEGIFEDFCINYRGTDQGFLKYVPSIRDEDKENFEIIAGYLIYTGKDDKIRAICDNLGMKSEYDQELYDVLGKEFAYYLDCFNEAKANGTIPSNKIITWSNKDSVGMSEFAEYAKIPSDKYVNEFELEYGTIAYIGTDEYRLSKLASSTRLKDYLANGTFLLPNYVAPETGSMVANGTNFTINNWTIEKIGGTDIKWEAAIVAYNGEDKNMISIPDTFNVNYNEKEIFIKIKEIRGDGTNSIFSNSNPKVNRKTNVCKVMVAKGISKVVDAGLANLGKNVQIHFLYVGSDMCLGNDKSSSNVVGYEGINNMCGSFTFVAPTNGNYTFKLWGASGGCIINNSISTYTCTRDEGLGGYSQGTVYLSQNEKIYCYIGGTGLNSVNSTGFEDGSSGYNGGGSGWSKTTAICTGGGGATDIRYGSSSVTDELDSRILVAGGGGGTDDCDSKINDGAGGCGGGTVYALEGSVVNKALWSGEIGYDCSLQNGNTCAAPAKWILSESEYIPNGFKRFYGQSAGYFITGNGGDMGGGGAGYFGGYGATSNNGGGGGGSAYADLNGIIKQVTNVQGYSGRQEGNGAEMLGRYGNGKLIISYQ